MLLCKLNASRHTFSTPRAPVAIQGDVIRVRLVTILLYMYTCLTALYMTHFERMTLTMRARVLFFLLLLVPVGVTPGMASSGESYVYDLYYAEDSLSDISDR